jgi:hypothetical protein
MTPIESTRGRGRSTERTEAGAVRLMQVASRVVWNMSCRGWDTTHRSIQLRLDTDAGSTNMQIAALLCTLYLYVTQCAQRLWLPH